MLEFKEFKSMLENKGFYPLSGAVKCRVVKCECGADAHIYGTRKFCNKCDGSHVCFYCGTNPDGNKYIYFYYCSNCLPEHCINCNIRLTTGPETRAPCLYTAIPVVNVDGNIYTACQGCSQIYPIQDDIKDPGCN